MTTRKFAVGDHVFCWRSYLGVPFAYQEHGIVVQVKDNVGAGAGADNGGEPRKSVVIVNFDAVAEDDQTKKDKLEIIEKKKKETIQEEEGAINTQNASNEKEAPEITDQGDDNAAIDPKDRKETSEHDNSDSDNNDQSTTSGDSSSALRRCQMIPQTFNLDDGIAQTGGTTHWEHVQYSQTQWHKRLVLRAGSCSPVAPDSVPVILARIRFLQEHSVLHNLPYDAHKRNGECLALWCQTGQYASHAGAAKLGQAGLDVGTFSLVGGIAAQLAASAVVPVLLPFMAAADVGQAVLSAKDLHQANKEWRERTVEWNDLFEQYILLERKERQRKSEANHAANRSDISFCNQIRQYK